MDTLPAAFEGLYHPALFDWRALRLSPEEGGPLSEAQLRTLVDWREGDGQPTTEQDVLYLLQRLRDLGLEERSRSAGQDRFQHLAFLPLQRAFATQDERSMVYYGLYRTMNGSHQLAVLKLSRMNCFRPGPDGAPPEVHYTKLAGQLGVGPALHAVGYTQGPGPRVTDVLLVMEYTGCDLANLRLSRQQALRVAQALTAQLLVLKENGVAHGDLKTENVCVLDHQSTTPQVRIIDYGMSHQRALTPAGCLTTNGYHWAGGTQVLNPPEKRENPGCCDCTVDYDAAEAWLLGFVLWDLFFQERIITRTHFWDRVEGGVRRASQVVAVAIEVGVMNMLTGLMRQDPRDRSSLETARAQLQALVDLVGTEDQPPANLSVSFGDHNDPTWHRSWGPPPHTRLDGDTTYTALLARRLRHY